MWSGPSNCIRHSYWSFMIFFKYLLLVPTILLVSSCSHTSPQSTENFDEKYSKLTDSKAPGFQILVIKNENVLRDSAFGYANLKNEKVITSKTRFRLASNTKAFTAAAALLLEQDGLLNVNDTLGKFFPDFPAELQAIKVKHLIFHTSGLPDYGVLCERKEATEKVVNNKVILKWLIENPKLSFKPGSTFAYSNTGYIVLATVIERIAKMSFPDFIQTRFFDPLKMRDATFAPQENRAFGYGPSPWYEPMDKDSCNYTYGDDGIFANTGDYSKWALAISEGRIFKPKFQKKIFESGKTDSGKAINYSYGWALIETDKGSAIAHSGSWVGFKSYARYYPAQNVWILLLSNYASVPTKEIVDHVVQESVYDRR
jgi:CubicO group peptidase (beta-lactamase class C family)